MSQFSSRAGYLHSVALSIAVMDSEPAVRMERMHVCIDLPGAAPPLMQI